jgi:hypothetical protein
LHDDLNGPQPQVSDFDQPAFIRLRKRRLDRPVKPGDDDGGRKNTPF